MDQYGSVRISMDQYGSVLGQYGSVLGQNGSVRIYTDLHGSVQDLYRISTDPHPGGRDRVHSVQDHYEITTKLRQICTTRTNQYKTSTDQYRSVQISTDQYSGRISTDQYGTTAGRAKSDAFSTKICVQIW